MIITLTKVHMQNKGWWNCSSCNYQNSGIRTNCRRCTNKDPNNLPNKKPIANTAHTKPLKVIGTCVICTENEKCVVLKTCGHFLYCNECSQDNRLTRCPVCRTSYTQDDLLKVYDV